jgi:hypothetical protein
MIPFTSSLCSILAIGNNKNWSLGCFMWRWELHWTGSLQDAVQRQAWYSIKVINILTYWVALSILRKKILHRGVHTDSLDFYYQDVVLYMSHKIITFTIYISTSVRWTFNLRSKQNVYLCTWGRPWSDNQTADILLELWSSHANHSTK